MLVCHDVLGQGVEFVEVLLCYWNSSSCDDDVLCQGLGESVKLAVLVQKLIDGYFVALDQIFYIVVMDTFEFRF